jgi:hypothetical protein
MNKKTELTNEGVIQASAIREASTGSLSYRYVLRRNPHNSGEFVVHLQTEKGYDNGFYTEDLESAALDLKARAEIKNLAIDNDQRCIGFDVVCVSEVIEYEEELSYKEQYGQCEDAPCCGCC